MSSELIAKIGFSLITAVWLVVFVRSLSLGKILFQQYRGTKYVENPAKFIRAACYHGLFVAVFTALSVAAWLFL